MRLTDLAGRHVVVLGLGIDTRAALDVVVGAAPASLVAAVDEPAAVPDEVRRRLAELGIALVDTDALPEGTEVVVRSPGYPRYRPSLVAAEQAGARVTTPTDLWLGEHGDRATIVGITGTKGKSTTAAAVGQLLRAADVDVVVAGNIGVPVWTIEPRDGSIVVLEVSSYQAVDVARPPDVGVLTSLSADHLSWHGGQERYEHDKLSLFGGPGDVPTLLVPAHEQHALAALAGAGLHPTPVAVRGSRFAALRAAAVEAHLTGPTLDNLALAQATAEAAIGRTLPDALVSAVVRVLQPLRGRHETVGVHHGVRYVDDALASNPSAAAAALDGKDDAPVTLLLGGEDRDVPLAPLLAVAASRTQPLVLVGLPDTGEAMARAVAAAVERTTVAVHRADDVGAAVRLAATATPSGGVVLFAPGAPTPKRYGTWEDRSTTFREAVSVLGD